jgi:hypothetical protein
MRHYSLSPVIPCLCLAVATICFTGAVALAEPTKTPHKAAPAPARYTPSTDWRLQRETSRNIYVLDHNLTIGDCSDASYAAKRRFPHDEIVCARD